MKPVSQTLLKYLEIVREELAELKNPSDGSPVEIPDYDIISEAAKKIDNTKSPVDIMFIIQSMLGRAKCVGFDSIDDSYKVKFPDDHHLHLNMGAEWYWTAFHADVIDENGNTGRLSALVVMEKNRCVGIDSQREAGWTDEEISLVTNLATVTIDMGPENRKYFRRSRNCQWGLKGGNLSFSKPGEKFYFTCGDDSMTGTENVLPLNVVVNDGSNMKINVQFTNQESFNVEDSFFLQGIPNLHIGGSGGTGTTPNPTPGIYYSWPQLRISGSVEVGGNKYTIQSGSGWIDHQLMMSSLQNPKGEISPVPFVDDFRPFNGWTWQFFNLENGDAFTGSSFITGEMESKLSFPYGYFISPHDGKWKAHYLTGESCNLYPVAFPSIVDSQNSRKVYIPLFRTFNKLKTLFGHALTGAAAPWHNEGTFNGGDWAVASEFPADFIDQSGEFANGVGYMESVGFQNVNDYREFAIEFLKNAIK